MRSPCCAAAATRRQPIRRCNGKPSPSNTVQETSMGFKVTAECVDIRNGKRFFPGERFSPEPDEDQAKRSVAARCLVEHDYKSEPAGKKQGNPDFDDMTKAQLEDYAKQRK